MLEGESWVFFFPPKLMVTNDFAVFLYLSSEMDGGEYFPEVPSSNIIDFCPLLFFFFFFIILVKMKLGNEDGLYDIC